MMFTKRKSIVVSIERVIAIALLLISGSVAFTGKDAFADVPTVGQWDMFEASIPTTQSYDNPYTDVALNVTLTRPNGQTVDFWGFYDGKTQWKFRWMPDTVGTWQYEARFSDGTPGQQGSFRCVASDIPGMISQDEANPQWFGFRGGKHTLVRSFHVGDRFFADTSNTITGEPWSPTRRRAFLDWTQRQGYNMLSVASHYLNRNVERRGQGWPTPDLWDADQQRPNPAAYARMEAVLNDLKARRIMVYPFAGFFGKESDFPHDPEAQLQYVKYTLARLAPYWNLLLLVGGPEPLYRKNPHLTRAEVNRLGKMIDSLDVFNHLLSVHSPTGDDPFRDETWTSYGILQGPKTVDRQELYEGLLRNHHPEKPLYAQETLWPGNTYGHPEYSEADIRKNAYVMMMAATAINFADMNGNSSSGFSGTIDLAQKVQAKHDVIKQVWDFFETIDFYRMTPAPSLVNRGYCLAEAGKQYLVYLENGEETSVRIPPGTYTVTWINAQDTHDRREQGITSGEQPLAPPDEGDDWLLWLTAKK